MKKKSIILIVVVLIIIALFIYAKNSINYSEIITKLRNNKTNDLDLKHYETFEGSLNNNLSNVNKLGNISINQEEKWVLTRSDGLEAQLTFWTSNSSDKKTELGWIPPNNSCSGWTDKSIYYKNGTTVLDDKAKAITLKCESAKCDGQNCYHISLTDAAAININNEIKLGETSSVVEYQTESKIEYDFGYGLTNITLFKNSSIDNKIYVYYSDNNNKYDFGANDTDLGNNFTNFTYIINSTDKLVLITGNVENENNTYEYPIVYNYVSNGYFNEIRHQYSFEGICDKNYSDCSWELNNNSAIIRFYSNGTINTKSIVNVSGCGTLGTANTYYQMNKSILDGDASLSGDCIIISAPNITFDCDGYSITQSENFTGVYSNQFNTTVKNCVVSMGSGNSQAVGIELIDTADNSTIYNNTVIDDGGYGMYYGIYTAAEYGNISNNYVNVSCTSCTAIRFNGAAYNNLENSIGYSYLSYGIQFWSSPFNDIIDSAGISDSFYGISLIASGNNSFTRTNATGITGGGLDIQSPDNNFTDLIAYSGSGSAIFLISTNNYFLRLNATGVNGVYLKWGGVKNNVFQDCINISATTRTVYTTNGPTYDNSFINCSYDMTKEVLDASSSIVKKWYYQAYVNDSDGVSVSGANVSAYNSSGDMEFSKISNSSGWINRTTITEYVNVGGTRNYYSNYSVNVTKTGYNNFGKYYNVTLNLNKINDTITLTLSGAADNPPVSILSQPSDNANYTKGTIVSFECNATDDSQLKNVTLTLYNPSGSINQTNFTTWTGTSNSTILTLNVTDDGLYPWNCEIYDNASQVDWGTNRTLNISTVTADTTKPYFTSIPSDISQSYPNNFGVQFNATDETSFDSYVINWSDTFKINQSGYLNNTKPLAVGNYYINVTINDSSNNLNSTIFNLNITQNNTYVLTIVISPSTSETYPTETTVTGSNCPSELICNLTLNSTGIVSNPHTIALGVGNYNYTFNTSGNTNYSSNSISDILTINQNTSSVIYTYLNNSRSNITIQNNTEIYLNSTLFNVTGTIRLYNNGTLINTGSNNIFNLTSFNNTGIYNITSIYSGNENYSSSSETWWVNVTSIADITTPTVNIIYPNNNTNSSDNTLDINYTASDDISLDSCWYSNDSYLVNTTLTDCTTNITSVIWSEGYHNVTIWVNDSAGNENSSSVSFTIDTIPPNVIVQSPTNGGGYNTSVIDFNVSLNEEGGYCNATISNYESTYLMTKFNTTYFNFTNQSVQDGTYTAKFKCVDLFGNLNDTETSVFGVDTTNPQFVDINNVSIFINQSVYQEINATDTNFENYAINWTDTFSIGLTTGVLTNISGLAVGIYWIEVTINDSLNNINTSVIYVNVSALPDTNAPYFTDIANISIYDNQSVSYDINAVDDYGNFDSFFINWTTNFTIDKNTGVLTNITGLNLGIYYINVSINDTSNNINSTIIWVNVSNSTILDGTFPTWDNLRNFSHTINTSFSNSITATDNIAIDTYTLNDTTYFNINSTTGLITNLTNLSRIETHWLNISVNDTSGNILTGIFYINITNVTSIISNVTLISPINNSQIFNNVIFTFIPYFNNNISNCSLIYNNLIYTTVFNIQKNVTNIITVNNIIYNHVLFSDNLKWSINCTSVLNNIVNSNTFNLDTKDNLQGPGGRKLVNILKTQKSNAYDYIIMYWFYSVIFFICFIIVILLIISLKRSCQ